VRCERKPQYPEIEVTCVSVSPEQEGAVAMSDRIAVISNVECQQIGTPTEIYEHTVNRFVADFIGDTNFLDSEIVTVNDDLVTCRVGANSLFEAENSGGHSIGDYVTLFLRPEKISLRHEAQQIGGNESHTGKVDSIVYLGNQAALTVDLGDNIKLTAQTRPREDGKLPFSVGDSLFVEFSKRALRVLAK